VLGVLAGIAALWWIRGGQEAESEIIQLGGYLVLVLLLVPTARLLKQLVAAPYLQARRLEAERDEARAQLRQREAAEAAKRAIAAERLDALREDGQNLRNAIEANTIKVRPGTDPWPPDIYIQLAETWERAVTICLVLGLPEYLERYQAVGRPPALKEHTERARVAWWLAYLDRRALALLAIRDAIKAEEAAPPPPPSPQRHHQV
jgi:hypothetical protein